MTSFTNMEQRIKALEIDGEGSVSGNAGEIVIHQQGWGLKGMLPLGTFSYLSEFIRNPEYEDPGRFYMDSNGILYYLDETFHLDTVFPQPVQAPETTLESGSNDGMKFGWVSSRSELGGMRWGNGYYPNLNEREVWKDRQLKPIVEFYAEMDRNGDMMNPTGTIVVGYKVQPHESAALETGYRFQLVLGMFGYIFQPPVLSNGVLRFSVPFTDPEVIQLMSGNRTKVTLGFTKT